jgi:succinoglycan biosynthesis transport protein ExoP
MTLIEFLRVLRARTWIVVVGFLLVVGVVTAVATQLPKQYTATSEVVIHSKEPISDTFSPFRDSSAYISTQVDIIRSRKVALHVVDRLKLARNASQREHMATVLMDHMRVDPGVQGSRVVYLSVTWRNAKFAAAAANAYAEAYKQTNLDLNVEPARKSAKWFDNELARLREQLDRAQQRLTSYQENKSILTTSEGMSTEEARLHQLMTQLVGAQGKTSDAEARLQQLEKLKREGRIDDLPEVLANTDIQELRSKLHDEEQRLSSITTAHPDYAVTVDAIKDLRHELKARLDAVIADARNEANLARAREKALRRSLERQENQVKRVKRDSSGLPALMREAESARRAYDEALKRYATASMYSHNSLPDVTILTEADVPARPSSPDITFDVILSIPAGMLVGVSLALLWELFDRRVRTKEDLAELTKLPLLGTIE